MRTHAAVRVAAERGELDARVAAFAEARRVEAIRVGEHRRVAVRFVDAQPQHPAGGDHAAVDLDRRDRAAVEELALLEAQRLHDERGRGIDRRRLPRPAGAAAVRAHRVERGGLRGREVEDPVGEPGQVARRELEDQREVLRARRPLERPGVGVHEQRQGAAGRDRRLGRTARAIDVADHVDHAGDRGEEVASPCRPAAATRPDPRQQRPDRRDARVVGRDAEEDARHRRDRPALERRARVDAAGVGERSPGQRVEFAPQFGAQRVLGAGQVHPRERRAERGRLVAVDVAAHVAHEPLRQQPVVGQRRRGERRRVVDEDAAAALVPDDAGDRPPELAHLEHRPVARGLVAVVARGRRSRRATRRGRATPGASAAKRRTPGARARPAPPSRRAPAPRRRGARAARSRRPRRSRGKRERRPGRVRSASARCSAASARNGGFVASRSASPAARIRTANSAQVRIVAMGTAFGGRAGHCAQRAGTGASAVPGGGSGIIGAAPAGPPAPGAGPDARRTRPMRFCMVTTFYPPRHLGGDAVYVQSLARALVRAGHEVDVVCCDDAYRPGRRRAAVRGGAGAARDGADGVRVHRIASPVLGRLASLWMHQAGGAGTLARGDGGGPRPRLRRAPLPQRVARRRARRCSASAARTSRLLTLHDYWFVCPTHLLWKNGERACDRPDVPRLHAARPAAAAALALGRRARARASPRRRRAGAVRLVGVRASPARLPGRHRRAAAVLALSCRGATTGAAAATALPLHRAAHRVEGRAPAGRAVRAAAAVRPRARRRRRTRRRRSPRSTPPARTSASPARSAPKASRRITRRPPRRSCPRSRPRASGSSRSSPSRSAHR